MRRAQCDAADIDNKRKKSHGVQNNKHKPCEQVNRERPVILQKKVQPGLIDRLVATTLRGHPSIHSQFTSRIALVPLGEMRRSDFWTPWSAKEGRVKRGGGFKIHGD